jgi:hypothetical protein
MVETLGSVSAANNTGSSTRNAQGQQKRLHKLINNPRLSDTRKANLIDSYIKAIPIGAVPK